jgi:hypothetical protein
VTSDGRFLQDALANGFYVPSGKFCLVDVGYANTPNFIALFRNVGSFMGLAHLLNKLYGV